jgi:hypothetical protein
MYNAYNNDGPTVVDCIFRDTLGGGMLNLQSAPTVIDCQFLDNWGGRGAGMSNDFSNVTMTGCRFERNITPNSTSNGRGGGIYNQNDTIATIINCDFIENQARWGGGIHHTTDGELILSECTFQGNQAFLDGGGAFISGKNALQQVLNCEFLQNHAERIGGGMQAWFPFGAGSILNCTFALNHAGGDGGGFFNTSSGNPIVNNSIFATNSDSGGNDITAQIFSENESLSVNYSCIQGGWTGLGSNNINADPLFVDPANGDLRLNTGFPCIDAGDNTAVPAGVTTDLAGNPRFIDSLISPDTGNGTPPIVDMGAHEAPVTVPADIDFDGDVDGSDFTFFAPCFNKAGNPPRTPGCPQY